MRKNSLFAFLHGRIGSLFWENSSLTILLLFSSIKHTKLWMKLTEFCKSPFAWWSPSSSLSTSSSVALSSFDTRDVKRNINHLKLNWDSNECLLTCSLKSAFLPLPERTSSSVIYHHFRWRWMFISFKQISFSSSSSLNLNVHVYKQRWNFFYFFLKGKEMIWSLLRLSTS